MVPAQQRLTTEDAPVAGPHDRLVLDAELPPLHGPAQVALEHQQSLGHAPFPHVDHLVGGAPTPLGLVHGDVGLAEQDLGIGLGGGKEMPTLADTSTTTSSSAKGLARARTIRLATMWIWRLSEIASHRRTNSSPESRASVSPGRMSDAMRSATATRSSSPTRCPWWSLTALKWSRSTKRMATGWPERMQRSWACSIPGGATGWGGR
jgi:hypothetical protein